MKFSENYTKLTLPGVKNVFRFTNGDGLFYADAITLVEEGSPEMILHPLFPEQRSSLQECTSEPLLHKVMEEGRIIRKQSTKESAAYARERLSHLAPEHKRFEYPHIYKVGVSQALMHLRTTLVEDFKTKFKV